MGPEHTFDLQLIRGRPVFDLILWDFFWLEGKKLEFLGEIFQTQTQKKNGWPDPDQNFLTRPINSP